MHGAATAASAGATAMADAAPRSAARRVVDIVMTVFSVIVLDCTPGATAADGAQLAISRAGRPWPHARAASTSLRLPRAHGACRSPARVQPPRRGPARVRG